MEIVLGALRRKKTTQTEAGSLLILICTDDELVGGDTGNFGESREVSRPRRESQVWADGAGPALSDLVARKSRTGSSSLYEQSCLVAKLSQYEDGWGWGRDRHRHLLV